MYCRECGKEIDDGRDICESCEVELEKVEIEEDNNDEDNQVQNAHLDHKKIETNKKITKKEQKISKRINNIVLIGVLHIIFLFVPMIPSVIANESIFNIIGKINKIDFNLDIGKVGIIKYMMKEMFQLTTPSIDFSNDIEKVYNQYQGFIILPLIGLIYIFAIFILIAAIVSLVLDKKKLFLKLYRLSVVPIFAVSLAVMTFNIIYLIEIMIFKLDHYGDYFVYSMRYNIVLSFAFFLISVIAFINVFFNIKQKQIINIPTKKIFMSNGYKVWVKYAIVFIVSILLIQSTTYFKKTDFFFDYYSIDENIRSNIGRYECEVINSNHIIFKETRYGLSDFDERSIIEKYKAKQNFLHDQYNVNSTIDIKHSFPDKLIITIELNGLENERLWNRFWHTHIPPIVSINGEDYTNNRFSFYKIDSNKMVLPDMEGKKVIAFLFKGYVTFRNNNISSISMPKEDYYKISDNTYYFFDWPLIISDEVKIHQDQSRGSHNIRR